MEAIGVLVVEDEELFRQMLRSELSAQPEIEVIGEASNGEEAVELAAALRPEVVLVDIELGDGINGIQAGTIIKTKVPGTGIVILSQHKNKQFISNLREDTGGGWSYLLKQNVRDTETLVRAIRGAAWGMMVIDPDLVAEFTPKLDSPLAKLTKEQISVMELLAKGYTNKAITEKLKIAGGEALVQEDLEGIYRELGIESTGEVDPRVAIVRTYLEETRSV